MIKNNHGYSTIEFLMVLGLLLLFTLSSLFLIRSGSDLYERMSQSKDYQTDIRIATAYINNKLRQNDIADSIQIKKAATGNMALVLTEKHSGIPYDTWVFSKDGYLKETMVPHLEEPDLDQSFEIIKLSSMNVKMLENHTLQVDLKDERQQKVQLIYKIKSIQ